MIKLKSRTAWDSYLVTAELSNTGVELKSEEIMCREDLYKFAKDIIEQALDLVGRDDEDKIIDELFKDIIIERHNLVINKSDN